jgi:hypothetical protein
VNVARATVAELGSGLGLPTLYEAMQELLLEPAQ